MNKQSRSIADVTVVGSGIIGLATAVHLQENGFDVEIVAKHEPGRGGASDGNCALLASGEIVPVSRPGVWRKIPKWLLDSESPVFVQKRSLLKHSRWLVQFLANSRQSKVKEISATLATLCSRAEEDHRAFLEILGLDEHLGSFESIMVFRDVSTYENDHFAWELRAKEGFDYRFLSRDELIALEPEIGPEASCGALLERWYHFQNPYSVCIAAAKRFEQRGGRFLQSKVRGFNRASDKISSVALGNGQGNPVNNVVIAAGAWSKSLMAELGCNLPIAPLFGYHCDLKNPGVDLKHAILYAEGGFVLTPLDNGLRIGGSIEIADLDSQPDWRRVEVLCERAQRLVPGLNIEKASLSYWRGPRPFTPDTIPIIGRTPNLKNVIIATGHGQLGLTLAPTTGLIVSKLLMDEAQEFDMSSISVERFAH